MKLSLSSKILITLGSTLFVAFASFGIIKLSTHKASYATVSPTIRNLSESVETVGKVKASSEVDLSFQSSGKIATVRGLSGDKVKRGQVIASLDVSDLEANLKQAKATLAKEQIKLAKLTAGSDSSSDIQTSIDNNKINLADNIFASYGATKGAIDTYTNSLFYNPSGASPIFGASVTVGTTNYSISLNDANLKMRIESERLDLTRSFEAWSEANKDLSSSDSIQKATTIAENTMLKAESFLADLGMAVSNLNGTDNAEKQLFDSYRVSVQNAKSSLDSTLSSFRVAEASYNSSVATVSTYEVGIQTASRDGAEASVEAIQASIAKAMIISPIDGVISRQDAHIGETISAGIPVAGVISDDSFEIEANVSEADVAKLHLGDKASVTLDAFSTSDIFDASIISIDQTTATDESIGSYKVRFLLANNPLIRSGMTANIKVITSSKEGALAIPKSAVITKNDNKYVLLKSKDGSYKEVSVTIGISDPSGYVEVVRGITRDDLIASFGNN